jgi:outer membrane protein assembly factor BamA
MTLASEPLPIRSIEIKGNKQTKDFVIKRELLFEEDSSYIYDESFTKLVNQSQSRITNLNLFNKVEITTLIDSINHYEVCIKVVIHLVEKWYHWPLPFVEFSDRNFNVWGNLNFDPNRTNYGLYVFNYNLWGRNHTLKTKLKTGYNTKLGLEYRIPFLSKSSNWGIKALVDYSSQNELWYETINDSLKFYKNGKNDLIKNTQATLEVSKRLTPYTRIYLSSQYQYDLIDSTVPANNYLINNARNQNTFTTQLRIEVDKRNNLFFPTEGSFVSADITGLLWSNQSQEYNLRMAFKMQKFTKIHPKIYTALSCYSQFNSNEKPPYSQRKILGYHENIRGFEHYVVDGTLGLKGNAAIRIHAVSSNWSLPFIPYKNYQELPVNIYWEIYSDAGYVGYNHSNKSNQLVNTFIYSGGVGLNTLFYNDRIVRLEYSLNSLIEHGFFVHFKKAI